MLGLDVPECTAARDVPECTAAAGDDSNSSSAVSRVSQVGMRLPSREKETDCSLGGFGPEWKLGAIREVQGGARGCKRDIQCVH